MGKRLSTDQVEIHGIPEESDFCIHTPRLILRPLQADRDLESYCQLFSDSDVRALYGSRKPLEREKVEKFVRMWSNRWHAEPCNPFGGFAVFLPTEHGEQFIGHVIVGLSHNEGETALAFLFHKEFWHQGFGTEATSAVVNHYIPWIIDTKRDTLLPGKQLQYISAEAFKANIYGSRILTTIGMTTSGEFTSQYGPKDSFQITRETLMKQYEETAQRRFSLDL